VLVTALQPQARRKTRLDVYLDGVVVGDISRRTAKELSLRPGLEVSEEQFEAIVEADRRRMALDSAVAMLARRPRSEREIRRRLKQRRLDDGVIDATVERLREARLLDDAEFARSFVDARSRVSPRSKRLLVQELRAAGVTPDVAAGAVSEQEDADAAYQLAESRLRSLTQLDERGFRARLGGVLQRRGFGWDVTRATVERCWREASIDSAQAD
jgi:regulatory protein